MKDLRSHLADWEDIALPLVLIATGFILVGGDYLGLLSLDPIQNLWPLAVIATGLVELIPMRGRSESEMARASEEQEKGRHARSLWR
jgi:hypothetical protein